MNNPVHLLPIAIALALVSCGGRMPNDVNKPLARAQVQKVASLDRVNAVVSEFSRKNHFAVQLLPFPRPANSDFAFELFRGDLTMTINRVHGGPILINAFPLCACELGRRLGLQAAADDSVAELKRELSKE